MKVNIQKTGFIIYSLVFFCYLVSGKLVYSSTFQNRINSIDMSKYSGGVYLLDLKNSSETQNIKIVK